MADGICGGLLISFISHKENYEDNFYRCIQESNPVLLFPSFARMKLSDFPALIGAFATVVATVDDAGLPVACAIDMMDSDGNSLYFLTVKGKSFYECLKKKGYLSLTGMKGKDTMSCTAVSVCGKVRELF